MLAASAETGMDQSRGPVSTVIAPNRWNENWLRPTIRSWDLCIVLADSTIFTTLFGGTDSLETFWKNFTSL